MTDSKPPEDKKEKQEKKERAPKPNRLSFYDDQKNGQLYLTVISNNDQYYFAYQNEGGEIEFAEELTIDGKKTLPQKIPEVNGRPSKVVMVPNLELLENMPVPEICVLAEELKQHIRRYFDAPDLETKMFIYYILYTWIYIKTDVAPILRFLADLGSGKSRGMDVIGDLCFYRIKLDGGTSLSSIMRTKQAWNGTVTMDEADIKQGYRQESGSYDDFLIKFLNLGFQRGKYILKTNTEDHDVQEVYDPYCPKILGMRAVFQDSATESRCLSYSPRETKNKDIPNILPPKYYQETDILVAKLARFALRHWKEIYGFSFANFDDVEIDGRTKQFSLPLSIVVIQLFPNGEEEFKSYIKERYKEIRRQRAQSNEGLAFNTLYAIAQGEVNLKEEFPDIYSKNEGIPIRVTPAMLAAAYGVKSSNKITGYLTKTLHFERTKEKIGGKSRTVIVVPNFETWQSAYNLYYFLDTEKDAGRQKTLPINCLSCPANLSRTGQEILEPLEPKPDSDQKGSKVPEVPITREGIIEKNNNKNTLHTPPSLELSELWNHPVSEQYLTVLILQDRDPFVGMDGQTYECRAEDILTLPKQNADVLIERGIARPVNIQN